MLSVVKNIDDYLLGPPGRSMFAFNMQFRFSKDLLGDLEVVSKGTESLMRNEEIQLTEASTVYARLSSTR